MGNLKTETALIDIRDIRSADADSYRERRSYTPGIKPTKPPVARFKMAAKFKDGNGVTRYSFDWHGHNGAQIHDEWYGYSALKKQLNEWENAGKLVKGKIWVNLKDKRPLTSAYRYNDCCFQMWHNKYTDQLVEKIVINIPFDAGGVMIIT